MLVLTFVGVRSLGQAPENLTAGSIEILVRDPAGTPIQDVEVAAIRTPTQRNGTTTTIFTDSSGRALFGNLKPGEYEIRAARPGYLTFWDNRRTFVAVSSVKVGTVPAAPGEMAEEHPMNRQIRVKLFPTGTLSGRVHDAKGRPIVGARVRAMTVGYVRRQSYLTEARSTQTDDRGEYRMYSLPAGEYYVALDDPRLNPSLPVGSNMVATTLYYPGTTDIASARRFGLDGGKEIGGIDFLGAAFPQGVTIAGTVFNSNTSNRTVSIHLMPAGAGLSERPRTFSTATRTGNSDEFPFQIHGVPRGRYDLYASFLDRTDSSWNPKLYMGVMPIEVGEQDISGIGIVTGAGVEVRGRVVTRGPQPTEMRIITVTGGVPGIQLESLAPKLPFDPTLFSGWSDEDRDAFTIANVMPGRYAISHISHLFDNYVSDILQDGRSVYEAGVISVSDKPVNIEVIVQRNGGTIYGEIDIPRKMHVSGAYVALVPDSPRRENLVLYKLTFITSDERAFDFGGIAPGRYKVFAFEDSTTRDQEKNPEFLAAYEPYGISVTVAEGIVLEQVRVPLILAR